MSETGGEAMKPFSGRVPAEVLGRIDDVAKSLTIPQSEVIRLALGLGALILQAGTSELKKKRCPTFNGIREEDYYSQYRELGSGDRETGFYVDKIIQWDWAAREASVIKMKLMISGAIPLLHETVITPVIERLCITPSEEGEWTIMEKDSFTIREEAKTLTDAAYMVRRFEKLRQSYYECINGSFEPYMDSLSTGEDEFGMRND